MSKSNISLSTIVNLLKFGRFQSDLELIKGARERYGRSGWNDRRVNGRRIKLGCRISDAATKFVIDALVDLFGVQFAVAGTHDWKTPQWRSPQRLVTAFWINTTNK